MFVYVSVCELIFVIILVSIYRYKTLSFSVVLLNKNVTSIYGIFKLFLLHISFVTGILWWIS